MPEFPYEKEFMDEIEQCIAKFGGQVRPLLLKYKKIKFGYPKNFFWQEGINLLKEHAKEAKETLESSVNQNIDTTDSSATQGWIIHILFEI